MCGGSVRMRNQPPQSYNNDEMTVLLDSDTQYRACIHSFPLLPLPIFNTPMSFASTCLPSDTLRYSAPAFGRRLLLVRSPPPFTVAHLHLLEMMILSFPKISTLITMKARAYLPVWCL